MKYMLDTNICVYIIKRKPSTILQKLLRKKITDIAISSNTLSELEYGVEKSFHRERNRLALAEFIAPLSVLSYDDHAALAYGKLRVLLEREGSPIGSLDTLIGAHALSAKAILVTNNEREFKRIPELKVENWISSHHPSCPQQA